MTQVNYNLQDLLLVLRATLIKLICYGNFYAKFLSFSFIFTFALLAGNSLQPFSEVREVSKT